MIDATNKEIDHHSTFQGNPAINTSGVTSKIVVKDGDTIVVGGVFKTTESFAKDGVPWLSEIPVLGWLFKYETKRQGHPRAARVHYAADHRGGAVIAGTVRDVTAF